MSKRTPRAERRHTAEVPSQLTKITRGFTFKLNLGDYQSADFFQSQTVECLLKDADEKAEEIYEWCKRKVLQSVREFQWDNRPMTPEEIRERKEKLAKSIKGKTNEGAL